MGIFTKQIFLRKKKGNKTPFLETLISAAIMEISMEDPKTNLKVLLLYDTTLSLLGTYQMKSFRLQ
jgi:hypothetical protein